MSGEEARMCGLQKGLQAKAGAEWELFHCLPTPEMGDHGQVYLYPFPMIFLLYCQCKLSLDVFTLAGGTPCFW